GWYDAGDYNKYTNWHADYLIALLNSYRENPAVWTDDLNLPESGNGIPDLLDEVKWGMDWLVRMQESNGSVLSVMGLAHASPPSSATGASTYGPATTAASYSSAAAFALGSQVLGQITGLESYAANLSDRAESAWQWAQANPSVTFRNSDNGVAAGEQEVDDYGRFAKSLIAAIHLYRATGKAEYRSFVESNYQAAHLMEWSWVSIWEVEIQHALLYFASLDGISAQVATNIRDTYAAGMNGDDNWPAVDGNADAYRASIPQYTWGSNRSQAHQGNLFLDQLQYDAGAPAADSVRNAALRHVNYLHGVNPQGKVYLSNMGEYGAENSVDSFYHSWFADGSAQWDSVTESSYGPAPGFLVGGPNPSYDWDACCPNSCGSPENNARCGLAPPAPPYGQPAQKSFLDFNTSWPLNSWAVTENHNMYQVAYIRLLSKFVPASN
ncbi:glycoside hydrolase family 9 protein, partial [Microbulbifer mangrovi]|uniref:glycoside hydrolase family 9 protein n=1 Tax=Microbulbifer mangrovi TaxID=927787 RepID=UPI0018745305